MGGLGSAGAGATGASSQAAAGGAMSGAAGATAATGGLAAPLMIGAGVGLTAYDLINSNRQTRKQLKSIKKQQLINTQNKKNLLEERLAARRARIGSMGISSDGSVAASNGRLAKDTFNDIAEDDEAYNSQYSDVYDSYRNKLNRNLIEGGMNYANKILK